MGCASKMGGRVGKPYIFAILGSSGLAPIC